MSFWEMSGKFEFFFDLLGFEVFFSGGLAGRFRLGVGPCDMGLAGYSGYLRGGGRSRDFDGGEGWEGRIAFLAYL